jgi:uncharacterized protein with GYD domain
VRGFLALAGSSKVEPPGARGPGLGHNHGHEPKGEKLVAKYLLQVNYTLDGVKGVLAEGGSARKAAAQAAARSAGGKVESFHFALGSTDAYVVADLPDNAAAAALALTVSAGGGATVATTALLTVEEVDKAADTKLKYRPPGS